jgi:hypothetical protein
VQMIKIVFYIVAVLMASVTIIGFNSGLSRFLFANGSDSLMTLVESRLYIRVLLLIAFIITIAAQLNHCKKIYSLFATGIFFLWLLSGRMIALFPDGSIITGWYYMQTNKKSICSKHADCEKVFYYETKYQKLFLWRYNITNQQTNISLFAGPFISYDIDYLFHNTFPNGGK